MPRRPLVPLVLVAAIAICGCFQSGLSSREQAIVDEAMKTAVDAPERVRVEIFRTCDKWGPRVGECVDDRVRLAQMQCWLEKGLPHLQSSLKNRIRSRARDRRVMLQQNLCMHEHGWRFLTVEEDGWF